MAEPITLTALLIAGAASVGSELVKESTKDAYRALKDKVGDVFGPRASKAVAKAEEINTAEEGGKELERYVGDVLEPDEAEQLQPLIDEFAQALKGDPAASRVAHARVGLDIKAGGNVRVRDIDGAREIAARIDAVQDVDVGGFRMDTGRPPGK